MDYEKEYKSLVAKVKKAHQFAQTDSTKSVLEDILPQLRESENERIRKHLVGIVELYWGKTNDPDKAKELAYLERMKEQKPISAAEVLSSAGLKPYKDGNQWCILAGDNIQDGICGFGDTIEDALYEFLKEVLDLQKEQKELPLMGGNADLYFDEWNQQKKNPTKRLCFVEGIRYAQRLQKEQKPAEYKPKAGEDIYHAINEAINLAIDVQRSVSLCFNGVTLNVFPESCISEIVSYYHEQVKDDVQRGAPAGWSEEDEKMRYFVTEAVQYRYSDRELAKYLNPKIINEKKQLKKKLFDWLRDLRPSWKPSEEQLNALNFAITYFMHETNYKNPTELRELYEQLKKL